MVIPATWAWLPWHSVDDVSVSRWDQVGGAGGGASEDGGLRDLKSQVMTGHEWRKSCLFAAVKFVEEEGACLHKVR